MSETDVLTAGVFAAPHATEVAQSLLETHQSQVQGIMQVSVTPRSSMTDGKRDKPCNKDSQALH